MIMQSIGCTEHLYKTIQRKLPRFLNSDESIFGGGGLKRCLKWWIDFSNFHILELCRRLTVWQWQRKHYLSPPKNSLNMSTFIVTTFAFVHAQHPLLLRTGCCIKRPSRLSCRRRVVCDTHPQNSCTHRRINVLLLRFSVAWVLQLISDGSHCLPPLKAFCHISQLQAQLSLVDQTTLKYNTWRPLCTTSWAFTWIMFFFLFFSVTTISFC